MNGSDQDCLYYVVLSTPRSGSTMLCDYLESVGLGFPEEHLRRPVLEKLKSRVVDFNAIGWFQRVVNDDFAKGNVFGTKLISHFLYEAVALLTEEERHFFSETKSRFKPIYLFRKDKLMQAISIFRAQQSKIWLPRNSLKVKLAQTTSSRYDFDEIQKRLNAQSKADRKLFSDLKRSYEKIHVVCYEDLLADKDSEMTKIMEYLDVRCTMKAATNLQVLRDEKSQDFAKQFEEDYLKKYGTEVARYYSPEA